jgi:hypothetical protein
VWKHIAPPFSPTRAVYCRVSHPPYADLTSRPPTSMFFKWRDGALDLSGWSFGNRDMFTALGLLAGIHRQEIEGDVKLLTSDRVIGDWICRKGASKQEMIAGLEKVLNRDCGIPVRLSLRDVKRQVFVANGEFKLRPLTGIKDTENLYHSEKSIYLYDKETPGRHYGGHFYGRLDQFVDYIGEFLQIRTASAVKAPPRDTLAWFACTSPEHPRVDDVKDRDVASVLKHVTEQTGLTFKEETRTVPVLFVEKAK